MTLLTCTSYQINSHRLLVRGKRVFDAPITPQTEEAEQGIDSFFCNLGSSSCVDLVYKNTV